MTVILKQFMTRFSGKMFAKTKFFLIFTFLMLPLFCSTSNVRKKRRQEIVETADPVTPIPDQLAVAAGTKPNFIHTDNPKLQRRGKMMIKILDTDDAASSTKNNEGFEAKNDESFNIEDTETAQDFVQRALQIREKLGINMLPHSEISKTEDSTMNTSIPRYDIFPKISTENPAQNFDPVIRSYDVYDDNEEEYSKPHSYQSYSMLPDTMQRYKLVSQNNFKTENKPYNAPLRSSSSFTQIPKEEIRQQIEKAVMKYMKQLESDGKLVSLKESKEYYRYPEQSTQTSKSSLDMSSHLKTPSYPSTSISTNAIKIIQQPKHTSVLSPGYKENTFQPGSPLQNVMENLNQDVEIIYKVKSRSPTLKPKVHLETLRNNLNFDHSSALKNVQGFDFSHVVQPEEERPVKSKLYFNSEVYQDINSMPYKPEKSTHKRPTKEPIYSDYRGYSSSSEAEEQTPSQFISLADHLANSGSSSDDGYPIMNPYQYVLHKEPKYAEGALAAESTNWKPSSISTDQGQQQTANKATNPQMALEFDSYSPKFNNNPEGYGYQHNYKHKENRGYSSTKRPNHYIKRGKRGGHKKQGRSNLNKDLEANVALRPPPK